LRRFFAFVSANAAAASGVVPAAAVAAAPEYALNKACNSPWLIHGEQKCNQILLRLASGRSI
jgi:hypothetical protein